MRSDVTAQSGGGATLWTYVMRRSALVAREALFAQVYGALRREEAGEQDVATWSLSMLQDPLALYFSFLFRVLCGRGRGLEISGDRRGEARRRGPSCEACAWAQVVVCDGFCTMFAAGHVLGAPGHSEPGARLVRGGEYPAAARELSRHS